MTTNPRNKEHDALSAENGLAGGGRLIQEAFLFMTDKDGGILSFITHSSRLSMIRDSCSDTGFGVRCYFTLYSLQSINITANCKFSVKLNFLDGDVSTMP